RNKAKIKIRQSLKKVIIVYKKEEIKNVKKAKRIISILTNIKKIEFKDSFEAKEDYEIIDTESYTVYLYKKIDKKLKEEGILREIIREIQEVRKKENLSIFEKINIAIDISNEEIKKLIEKHKEIIENETNSILFFEKASKYELDLDGIKIFIEIKK
ncbi:MAG: DUF5915 domain-containing protein, partial [Candidatus Aenigmatarchaeota archaeon]